MTGAGRPGMPGKARDGSVQYEGKRIVPGMIMELNEGDEAQMLNPAGQGADATNFLKAEQRMVSAAARLPGKEGKVAKKPMKKNPDGGNDYALQRSMPAQIRAVEGEGNERKFTLSFSSEAPYDRWYGTEILDHSEDMSRLQEIGVVLYNHRTDQVVGKVLRAWVENGRGEAEIEFDDDDASEVIRRKVAGGTLKGVSVGITSASGRSSKPTRSRATDVLTGHAISQRNGRRWRSASFPYRLMHRSASGAAKIPPGRNRRRQD